MTDRRFRRPALRTCVLLCLATLALAGCGRGDDKKKPAPTPEVGVVVLRAESLALTTELAGRTAAYETSDVRPQVSGIVKARLFTEGSVVRQGQTLYQIDASLYQAAVAVAEANLASARANEAAARVRADRLRPLAEIEAVSRQDFTDADALANQATAAVAQNRAQLDTARINLRHTRVDAPITGRIGRSIFTTGALVSAAQAEPLTTIQRLDPMFVDIQQSSIDLLQLRQALAAGGVAPNTAQVRLTLEDGSNYARTGTLLFTETTVSPDTGTVNLRARFDNPAGLLLPGMFVRATIAPTRDERAILLPQQGIAFDTKGRASALVVGPDGKVAERTVVIGRAVGNRWLVASGVTTGERVVVEALPGLRAGQVVRPVPAGSAASGPGAASGMPGGASAAAATAPRADGTRGPRP